MSVGKICDEGYKVIFDRKVARIINEADGSEICQFHRQDNGLYTAKLRLKALFARRG